MGGSGAGAAARTVRAERARCPRGGRRRAAALAARRPADGARRRRARADAGARRVRPRTPDRAVTDADTLASPLDPLDVTVAELLDAIAEPRLRPGSGSAAALVVALAAAISGAAARASPEEWRDA